MKKISALLIAAFVLFGALVFPASAADNANYPVEIPFVGKAPKCDGVIDNKEYGEILPVHNTTKTADSSQFDYDHDEYKDWNIDFYACWSDDGIYLAWDVISDQHTPLPKAEFGTDGKPIGENFTEESLDYMWMYSSVTVIITPGNPTKGDYSDNYLKIGLCELEDHSTARIFWERPDNMSDAGIPIDSWNAKVVRDDKTGTTTYELFVPWEMSGFLYSDLNFDGFGLSYAVASQEYYGDKQGIIEWQGGVIHNENPNNAGVITLEPMGWIPIPDPEPDLLPEGKLPDEAEGEIQLTIDRVDSLHETERSAISNKFYKVFNYDAFSDSVGVEGLSASFSMSRIQPMTSIRYNPWVVDNAYLMLLEPVAGKENVYRIIETLHGSNEEVKFKTKYSENLFIAGFSSAGGTGLERKQLAMSLPISTELVLFGVDSDGKQIYKNIVLYTTDYEPTENPPSDTSDVISDTASDSVSDIISDTPSDSSAPPAVNSSDADKAIIGGADGPTAILVAKTVAPWIFGAVLAVLAVAAVVAVIIIKKKKAK